MAFIQKDPRSPGGVWYAAYQSALGKRIYRSTRTRDKRRAQTIADAWAQAEHEAKRGELTRERVGEILSETLKRIGLAPQSEHKVTVASWLGEWLDTQKTLVKPATFEAYDHAVREFLEWLGPERRALGLESVSEVTISDFVRFLAHEGRSASRISTIVRSYLSIPFERARKLGRIRFNPVAAVQLPKVEKASKETFTLEQVRSLLASASPEWQGAILFAWSTGARLGDVQALRWNNLDVANGIVTFVEQKTGARATIGLHPDFLDWLSQQEAKSSGPVFPVLAAGSTGRLSKAFALLMVKAGIENRLLRAPAHGKGRSLQALSFHSFRHTAASSVFNAASLKEITRRVTNHQSGVIDRYLHQDLQSIREAVNLIPRLPR